jgi:predicted phosphoribosyltransferase
VALPDVLDQIGEYADEVVCLPTPNDFRGVGQFYRNFNQVEDDEVIAVLTASQGAPKASPPPTAPASSVPT